MTDHAHAYEAYHEREPRLLRLGLDENLVVKVAERGLAARRTCTKFDTPSFPGYLQWNHMHRALRELLWHRDWAPDDDRNFSRVVRPDGAIALTVATGDELTGLKPKPGRRQPTTKYPKGTETDLAIEVNVQLGLFDDPPVIEDVSSGPPLPRPVRQTWWLLNALVDGELRFELSCPEAQDERGHIVKWSERIIFEPISLDGIDEDDDQGDDGDGIDVPIERL